MKFPVFTITAALVLLTSLSTQSKAQPIGGVFDPYQWMFSLSQLPALRTGVTTGMVSSYDRTGGNDDGFSGKYSFLRKENGALVIADLEGPGCITRIWTPTPSDSITEFYFDGESIPRLSLKFSELFNGTRPPFTAPLSGFGGGGYWTYLPMPYAKSCKVLVRAERFQFYQINFAKFTDIRKVESWSTEKAVTLQGDFGSNGSSVTTAPKTAIKNRVRLTAGKPAIILNRPAGGTIVSMKLSPASAFAGKDRSILLRASFDGLTTVNVPAGDFFGYAWGDPSARSAVVGSKDDVCYSKFPMPFAKSARIELLEENRSSSPRDIVVEFVVSPQPKTPNEGYFHAAWRRENPTTIGKPFTFVDLKGRGHLVGVILQSQGMESGNTFFFEGDDQAIIDGQLAAHGTGSEDFFNGGWYDVPGRWEHRFSLPLSGCLDYKKALGRTGAFRIFLGDAYVFEKSLNLAIEHAGEKNNILTDYAAVSFYYALGEGCVPPPPGPLASRKVTDFTSFVYVPGWSVPLESFPFENSTISKHNERIAGKDVRYLRLEASKTDIFGGPAIAFQCEIPTAGRYAVFVKALEGPTAARIQLVDGERPVGPEVEFQGVTRKVSDEKKAGELDLVSGVNPVMLRFAGTIPKDSKQVLEIVSIRFEKVR